MRRLKLSALALALGPAAYWFAHARRRLWLISALYVAAVVAVLYVPYLNVFVQLDGGGESARELVDVSIAASTYMLHHAGDFAWLVAAVAGVVHLGCAVDLAVMPRKEQ